ncbi:MAG TPA: serine/threonine-protein kinase, partial [Planctomycetota bacterium]|nr:serine/threonine-protein kinase [Planctomycetota bacterium]
MSALPRVPGFEVEGLLGRGGMGTVYRAREVVTRRGVALKWLPAHAKPEQRARFEREARAAATLEHPHVVRVHAAGTDANGCWIAMELVEGFDLAEAIEARSLDQRVAVEIVAKVARALEAAHAAGIVHRDVKPANIMVDEKGEPRLVDFGLASIVRDAAPPLTRPNTILGTVAYMSPEVASSGALVATAASDVFSLGCVLYEVLTGRLPFAAPTAVESMVRLISGEMDPFDEKTPPSLAAACRRALARDPAARPRAGDLASE